MKWASLHFHGMNVEYCAFRDPKDLDLKALAFDTSTDAAMMKNAEIKRDDKIITDKDRCGDVNNKLYSPVDWKIVNDMCVWMWRTAGRRARRK